jgi:DNA segregation ATPase FtsK/SpoIIIE-like protein
VYSTAKELCHVAIAGVTGGGKTSLIRLIMCQLCQSGANVLLLNPHYTHYDIDAKEDWTPFEPYLIYDPMECRKYETIEFYLKQVATELVPKRLEKYAQSIPVGRPYFIVLDELPAIIRHIPDAPEYLATILQEGRKVGIFLVTAAQDFLVKTVAPQGGGAIRDCYRTAIYVGGDPTTAKVLLDIPANQIQESELGKGIVMLRNVKIKQATMARVPYVDNQALYQTLGPSTYRPVPANERDDIDDLVPVPAKEAPSEQDVSIEQLLTQFNSLPDVDPGDNRYNVVQTEALVAVDDEEEEEDDRVVLGRKNTGEVVSISKEEFQVAVRMRKAGMSTGYRDFISVFNVSEHHAKALNSLVRQELSSETVKER